MKVEAPPGLADSQALSPARLAPLLATLCALLFSSHSVLGWGAQGHKVVAQMAYNHLTPAVQAKCDALIAVTPPYGGGDNFVTASTWADTYKTSLGTGTSHYIDLPFSLDGTSTNGHTAPSPNVVTAINDSIATLTNSSSSQSAQAVALRYLIHFVGDIQQPCHSSEAFFASAPGGDAGGNGFYISGTWGNLHSLWDAGGGYLTDGLTVDAKVAAIEADYPYTPNPSTIPNPMDWAQEGLTLAVTNAYVGITQNTTPSAAYLNKAKATTEQRMAAGGHRLADLLNTIFGKLPATVTLSPLAQTYNASARIVTASTSPAGLTVNITYNGSASAPTNAGNYTVIGTINDSTYQGSATNTLVVGKATATVTLGNLAQTYNGTAKSVSVTTAPASLATSVTYNGSSSAPTNANSYAVVATVVDPNYQGSATDTLVVLQPPPIELCGSVMLQGTGFGFTFTNMPGLSFTVLSAANAVLPLSSWTVAGSATEISPGQYQFSDPQATNNPQRFYRVRSP